MNRRSQNSIRRVHHNPLLPLRDMLCKWANGYTATGTKATEGRTIAVDPDIIPYGTTVIIDDHEYIAEDCGVQLKAIELTFTWIVIRRRYSEG